MMKHTPGPWKHEIAGSNHWVYAGERVVAFIGGKDTLFTFAPHTPHTDNARLIAAAPELLGALKLLKAELHKHVKLDVRKHYSLMVADAAAGTAIHKAEGGNES